MAPPGTEDPLMTIVSKLEENTKMLSDMRLQMMSMEGSLRKVADDQMVIESWKPEIDEKVSSLQESVMDLKHKVDLVVTKFPKEPAALFGVVGVGTATSAQLDDPAKAEASGQASHHVIQDIRGLGAGGIPPASAPGKGVISSPTYTPPHQRVEQSYTKSVQSSVQNPNSVLPQVNFPVFDGSNPKMWKRRCENFFQILYCS